MRGRSYSPSPPPRYSRRGRRSPSPRGGRYSPHGRDHLPTSLLVRNLRHDCRTEDIRRPFGEFGALRDIFLPRDYFTGDLRGYGFVEFADPADAAEAKYHMDRQVILGRELNVVFAWDNRKKPTEMRRGHRYHRRRSPPPPPRRRSRDYYSSPPKRREYYSRSASPEVTRYSRQRSRSHHNRERLYSRSPPFNGDRRRSPSPSPAKGPRPKH